MDKIMKIDLKGISLMIHFRRDIPERYRNLKAVVEFYRRHSENLQIVVINDDKEPDEGLRELKKHFDCDILFFENSDIYWRTLCFNKASKECEGKCIIAGDTDVFIHPEYLKKAYERLMSDRDIGIVYPYNGMFVHLKNDIANKFFENFDIEILESKIPTLKPEPYFQTDDFLVAHPHSKGGCIMFRFDAFMRCNGYNPHFRGWGFEDDEIQNRFSKLGYNSSRVFDTNAIAWHLPHDNTVREKHPYYQQNYQHSEFVGKCVDLSVLNAYISGWTI